MQTASLSFSFGLFGIACFLLSISITLRKIAQTLEEILHRQIASR